ncbi:DUF305 domain-containing protein [Antrihabitans sp. YC2-6]|nr:DUF305 domain-containing protein [Antrihabitans sp. YC2-6]
MLSDLCSKTRVFAAALATTATLFSVGCNADQSTDSSNTTSVPTIGSSASTTISAEPHSDFNDADVAFLELMYPHHAQAIEMAKMVTSRSQNPKVLELATGIEAAQQPEMAQISTVLVSFGKPAPIAGMDHSGADHGGGGMMNRDDMQALADSSGVDFDRMFLTMMIEHHRGAIEMANVELADGRNAEVKQLAEAIVSAQQAEIGQMNALLAER